MGPSIKDIRTYGEEEVSQKLTAADREERVSQMWMSALKNMIFIFFYYYLEIRSVD